MSDKGWRSNFAVLAIDVLPDGHLIAAVDKYLVLSRYRYTKSGERVDNVTDWAVAQFRGQYSPSPLAGEGGASAPGEGPGASAPEKTTLPATRAGLSAADAAGPSPTRAAREVPSPARGEGLAITKDAIFAYCYAVLHDPVYRETYALNLKREFPRIPFYPDFAQWVAWGEALLKFNTYRFAKYKESMIDLLAKVVTVSVETVATTEAMRGLDRSGWDKG